MPNIEDFNTSFNESIDFSPIASSSQQCIASKQLVANRRVNNSLQFARNMKENLPGSQLSSASSFSLWSSYMSHGGNENEQEITLTQLHAIESTHSLWNLRQWEDASEEYYKEMEHFNIREIKRQMKNLQGNVFPFLIAVVVKEDTLDLKSTVTVTLRDPSGEIKAMFSKDIFNYNQHIQPNSVLVLRHFRVIPIARVTSKCYYLMLNKMNIEAIFSIGTDNSTKKILLLHKDDIEKHRQMTVNNIKVEQTPKTHENERNALSNASNTITNKPKHTKTSNFDEKAENTFSNQTTFVMPDLDFDMDLDVDMDLDSSFAPCKKSKHVVDLVHDQQQRAQQDRVRTNAIPDVEQANKIVTNAPKKAFKYVKKNHVNTVPDEVRTSVIKHLDSGDFRQKPPVTQFMFKTQNPDDTRIVEEAFDGLDASFLLDDF